MNWKDVAIGDLLSLNSLKVARNNLQYEIDAIETNLYNIKAIDYDRDIVDGGDQFKSEDVKLDNIVKKEKLKARLNQINTEIEMIDKGMNCLDEIEKKVLDYFYISRPYNHIRLLMDELHYEKSQVYRLKDEALSNYTAIRYGNINL
ncbi:DUF1492 domain-containing protein [Helcococcus kunzii]|uniref:DUF1492 domain-containing protein n=1 Tax=Helcococcus kunzii TaxID=40091 RepID=UPI001BB0884F|nr:DUF1492 domain-containing protein [Helcococcus kunzii]QUY65098.1 DUF1492 domain-containing protein [Helcococcus kunzii]